MLPAFFSVFMMMLQILVKKYCVVMIDSAREISVHR